VACSRELEVGEAVELAADFELEWEAVMEAVPTDADAALVALAVESSMLVTTTGIILK
jgi:hypothetical protein